MPSKTLWLNKQIILQTIRSSGWIPLIYFLGLLLALPLDIFRRYENDLRADFQPPYPVGSLFEYNIHLQIAMLVIVPVLMAVFLFRFLNTKPAAEMMHSLPIKREKIFFHYTLSGFVGLMLPVVLTALIVILLYQGIDLQAYFGMKDIFIWAGTTVLLNLVIFTAGVLVAMLTGLSVLQAVFTYVFLFFPAGMLFLIVANFHFLWYGFPMDYYLSNNMEKLSPLLMIAMIDELIMDGTTVALYGAALLVFYGFSLFLYKIRKIESATEAIAFPKLRFVFKYGLTFCVTLLGGVYFAALMEGNRSGWLIFGYIIGAIIGYYGAEMILRKTWRVFNKAKGLLLYSASMTVLFIGIHFIDIYENHLPEEDEIKQVYFSDSPYVFTSSSSDVAFSEIPDPLQEENNIDAVRALHQQIIDKKDEGLANDNGDKQNAFFLYELKNGRKMVRQYLISRAAFTEYLAAIEDSEEYKRATHSIFKLNADAIKFLTLSRHGVLTDQVSLNERKDIEEFLNTYRKDVLAQSYEDKMYFDSYGTYVELFISQEYSLYLPLAPSYKETIQWLKEKNLFEQISITPEEIASIEIVKSYDFFAGDYSPDKIEAKLEGAEEVLKIEDKEQMGILLQSTTGWVPEHHYTAVIRYNGINQVEVVYMDEQHAPEFVQEYFRQ